MQGSDTQNPSNVVSLFASRNKAEAEAAQTASAVSDKAPLSQEEKDSFDSEMERNVKNNERLRKERLNANKSVLRSYRIKN